MLWTICSVELIFVELLAFDHFKWLLNESDEIDWSINVTEYAYHIVWISRPVHMEIQFRKFNVCLVKLIRGRNAMS